MSGSLGKTLLITGATGQQGRAVISALLANPSSPPFKILALTRSPTSPSAVSLAALSPQTITLLQGDLDSSSEIFASAAKEQSKTPIWGVFSVQTFLGGKASVQTEEQQGKALIDAAIAHNVKHFVYTSVERGAQGKEENDAPTPIPHYASKYRIEQHLKEKAAAGTNNMSWTILRPTGFMENLNPGFFGAVSLTALKVTQLPTSKTCWIAVSDIGWFAAQAFLKPDEYRGMAIPLAGDQLTYKEIVGVIEKVTGKPPKMTYEFLVKGFLWYMAEFGAMFRFFREVGNRVDVDGLRKIHPGLMDLETWMRRESRHVVKKT